MANEDTMVGHCPRENEWDVMETYDWSATNPSTAVVETVSAVTGTEPTELDTLQSTIDADALDVLFAGSDGTELLEVTFKYAGTVVMVRADGTVAVTLE